MQFMLTGLIIEAVYREERTVIILTDKDRRFYISTSGRDPLSRAVPKKTRDFKKSRRLDI